MVNHQVSESNENESPTRQLRAVGNCMTTTSTGAQRWIRLHWTIEDTGSPPPRRARGRHRVLILAQARRPTPVETGAPASPIPARIPTRRCEIYPPATTPPTSIAGGVTSLEEVQPVPLTRSRDPCMMTRTIGGGMAAVDMATIQGVIDEPPSGLSRLLPSFASACTVEFSCIPRLDIVVIWIPFGVLLFAVLLHIKCFTLAVIVVAQGVSIDLNQVSAVYRFLYCMWFLTSVMCKLRHMHGRSTRYQHSTRPTRRASPRKSTFPNNQPQHSQNGAIGGQTQAADTGCSQLPSRAF
jgi:hypothetical protein